MGQLINTFYISPLITAATVSGTLAFFRTGGLFVSSPLFAEIMTQRSLIPGLGVSAYAFPLFRTCSGAASFFHCLPFSIGMGQLINTFYISPFITAAAVSGTLTFFRTGGFFICSPLFAEIMTQRIDWTGLLIAAGTGPDLCTGSGTGRLLCDLPWTEVVFMLSGKDKIHAGFLCITVGGGAFLTDDGDTLLKGTGFNAGYAGRDGDFF